MAVVAATLKARWVEFAPIADAVVAAAIAEATAECDERVFGASFDHAVALLACHKLAMASGGQTARQEGNDKARTTYLEEWRRLARTRGGGPHITGYTPGLTITGITGGNMYTSMVVNPVTHELFVSNWSQNGLRKSIYAGVAEASE